MLAQLREIYWKLQIIKGYFAMSRYHDDENVRMRSEFGIENVAELEELLEKWEKECLPAKV